MDGAGEPDAPERQAAEDEAADRLWAVPVALPDRYWQARLLITTASNGSAKEAAHLAGVLTKMLNSYLPDAHMIVTGDPAPVGG